MKTIYGLIAGILIGAGAIFADGRLGRFFVIQEGPWQVFTQAGYSVFLKFDNKDERVCYAYRGEGGGYTISEVECAHFEILDRRTLRIDFESGQQVFNLYNPLDNVAGSGDVLTGKEIECGGLMPPTESHWFVYPTLVLVSGKADYKCFYLKDR